MKKGFVLILLCIVGGILILSSCATKKKKGCPSAIKVEKLF